MSSNSVITTIDNRGIATVTLNRPEKHNAFDDEVIAELTTAFKQVDSNNSVRAMILASEGKNFSSGGDLAWMKRMANYSHEENLNDARALANMLKTLNFLSKPTIARVQGAAYGGAVGLVSCCDIAIATSESRFCLSEVKIGLVPATIGPYVIAAMGPRACRRYFTSAEVFSAQRAYELGLISEVVAQEQIDETINNLTNTMISNGPTAVSAAKQLIFDFANQTINSSVIEHSCRIIAERRASGEGQEGLSAFLEKRKPSWLILDKE